MTTTKVELIKSLTGRRVRAVLSEAAGGRALTGRLVGTLEAADGMVVFFEPDDAAGTTFSCNYQHLREVVAE